MRKRIRIASAAALAALSLLVCSGSALAAEHHPPKFGVKQTQCTKKANQPNCPGSH